MTSAGPQKRMVSSVFITLASPYKATVTQHPQIHNTTARDTQHAAVPVSPGGEVTGMRFPQRKPAGPSPGGRNGLQSSSPPLDSPKHTQHDISPSAPAYSAATSASTATPALSPSRHTEEQPNKVDDNPEELSLPPPPPPASLDSELSDVPSAPLPPPPLREPTSLNPPSSTTPQPASSEGKSCAVEKVPVEIPPSGGVKQNEMSPDPYSISGQETNHESKELCGFCRKAVAPSEPAIEALKRTYHATCFQCRQCHIPLAGKMYYNKAGIPLCEDCYQASLEPCWACGDVIKDQVIRALERAYHPPCFVCTTCSQPIGDQRFAQGEVGEVYCLQDYYRKYAPQCSACADLIIPREDGTDSFTVECLGRPFHEDCYRCEVCNMLLSPEPNDQGCHPLEGQILCKSCHLTLLQTVQH